MKNQSFHPRKIRIQDTQRPSFEELKARTINALNKLGQQKFSAEPGGYSLDNWIRGVNILLDEFEKEAGRERLSPAYLEARRQLNMRVSEPVSTSSIDGEISELRRKSTEVEGRIEAARAQVASRLAGLKDEESRRSEELASERDRISSQAAAQNSGSIFKRLLGGNKQVAKDSGDRIDELQSRLDALPGEMAEQQRLLGSIDKRSAESPCSSEWNELESLQARLEVLEGERLAMVQLVKEREEIAGSIAKEISTMGPSEPTQQQGEGGSTAAGTAGPGHA